MSEIDTNPVERFEYQAEMKQLLHLIVHSLYTHQEIFLRELISNASDALNKIRFRQLTDNNVLNPEAEHRINIHLDAEQQLLVIEDSGIGMTHEDLVQRIGTVASSGTLAFLEKMKDAGKPVDAEMIGQFGVGFYSAFMVADRITIETRHADLDSHGYLWESDGTGTFTVQESDKLERGTRITLHLKEDAKEYCQEYRVQSIIQKYSNFVDFPIFIGETQANTVRALWRKKASEVSDEERDEFFKFISNDFGAPLGHLHLHIEGRVNFDAMLFVPSTPLMGLTREEHMHGLHLYSNSVFIQDDCKELLPEYLRFIRGVVDTEDLPLHVSRELTQTSPVMTKIRSILTGKLLGMLEEWAENDGEKFDTFYSNFGSLFKTGLSTELSKRDQVVELVRYESTNTEAGKTTSLKAYVERMHPDQEEIYYVMGDHRNSLEHSPNLEYFRRHDLEVLFLTDPVDVFTFSSIPTYAEKPLKSIEKADLDLKKDAELEKESLASEEVNKLLALFKTTLGDKVEDVVASKRLVDSAVTLVVGEKGMDKQAEWMMRLMNQDIPVGAKVLEVNTAHILVKNLAHLLEEGESESLIEKAIWQLYEGALLVRGNLNAPSAFVERMTELMVRATKTDEKA